MTQSRRIGLVHVLALAGLIGLATRPLGAQPRTEREAFTWSGRIPQGRWITVRNMNGSVDVEPIAGDRVEVTAMRHTRRGDPEHVRFEVRKYGPAEQDVLICALWGENADCDEDSYRSRGGGGMRGRSNDVRVEFRVRVPRGVKIGAHSVNGDVRVENVATQVDAETVNGVVVVSTTGGPVNARTTNGDVKARMGRFDLNSDLNFSSTNGSVVAEFEGDINAQIDLSTVNGRFLTDFPVTISGRIDPRRLRATLGKGGPRIRLATVNGNVELRKR